MRWLLLALAIVTVGAASQPIPDMPAAFLKALWQSCSEDVWVRVPGYDVEVTCVARKATYI